MLALILLIIIILAIYLVIKDKKIVIYDIVDDD